MQVITKTRTRQEDTKCEQKMLHDTAFIHNFQILVNPSKKLHNLCLYQSYKPRQRKTNIFQNICSNPTIWLMNSAKVILFGLCTFKLPKLFYLEAYFSIPRHIKVTDFQKITTTLISHLINVSKK